MATIGVSKPYIARYNNTNGVITYSNGMKLAKAIEYSSEIDTSEDNDLYADNGKAESDRSFSGGTVTITTDDLEQGSSAMILGVVPQNFSIDGEQVEEMIYDDDLNQPYVGMGIIIKKKKNNQIKWRAVILTKLMFSIPSDSATTQGETIEWQTPELTATINRDDSEKHRWKREATFDTEAKAERYIRKILNIPELGVLTLTSVAGANSGETDITVAPEKVSTNKYFYQIGESVGLPDLNEPLGDAWIEWDGTVAIVAASGMKIAIVETDEKGKSKRGGITTVIAKETPLTASLTITQNESARSAGVKISVIPLADFDNTYRYKETESPALPAYDEILSGDWEHWDGTDLIACESGKKMVVVEVDHDGKAKRAGILEVR